MATDTFIPSIAVFLPSKNLNYHKLIDGILEDTLRNDDSNNNSHPSTLPVEDEVVWRIENKYYQADVNLSVLKDSWTQHLDTIRKRVEAMIIYCDVTDTEAIFKLDKIISDLDGFELDEACLLVCDGFDSNAKLKKSEATEWCIKNGWELVELEPVEEETNEEDLEDDFLESLSFARIIGAMNANRWSNMSKKKPKTNESNSPLSISSSDPFFGSQMLSDDLQGDGVLQSCPAALDLDEFESLFSKFNEMRITASSLPHDKKLDYAEGVAKSFMEAMGITEEDKESFVTEEDRVIANQMIEVVRSSEETSSNLSPNKSADEVEKNGRADLNTSPLSLSSDCSDVKYELVFEEDELKAIAELGFPVLENETVASDESDDMELLQSFPGAKDNPPAIDVLPEKTYDEIEEEIRSEELKKMLDRVNERTLIDGELEVDSDAKKRKKSSE